MSELEATKPQPDLMAFVEYQIVRMDGAVLVSFLAPLGHAIMWLPEPGMEIWGPCAGRYRIVPGGPWIVRAYYPEGYPGPQGEWPADTELGGEVRAIC